MKTMRKRTNMRRRYYWKSLIMARIATMLLLCVPLIIGIPAVQQAAASQAYDEQTARIEARNTPQSPVNKQRLQEAREYNQQLARTPQLLGEALDPFGKPKGDFSGAGDKTYEHLLDDGAGLMGVIKIPSLNLSLPIYHGSSAQTLSHGVGHLHGTSLPVGGVNTHSVLTAHRGFNSKLLFTRLDELQKDDLIELKVEGETLDYFVTGSRTVLPTDLSTLNIHKGQDEITLVTCTPIGVNTHRLLVTARRVSTPQVQASRVRHANMKNVGLVSAGALAAGGGIMLLTSPPLHVRPVKHERGRFIGGAHGE